MIADSSDLVATRAQAHTVGIMNATLTTARTGAAPFVVVAMPGIPAHTPMTTVTPSFAFAMGTNRRTGRGRLVS